ncbi:MBL fold metallo-hydrolase [Acidobacteria bacterium AH-259-D05]|nr:MBL fold metallo-hydrolase [Acidobacteria bacterium AH-259-D05]
MLTIQFLGAAQTVTGSRFFLRVDGKRLLIDCGLFQGGRALKERNWEPFPVPPDSLDGVILTHAHIDHSGYLPRLMREGFQGPICCTPATADLLSLLLPDSGHLQERDAAFANKKKYSRHDPALPLYTEEEAREVLKHLQTVSYHEPHTLTEQLNFEYLHAGHILGSAMIRLNYTDNGTPRILFFTGDLGRADQPVIKDPETIERADFLLLESTYGDRIHQKTEVLAYLEKLVQQTVKEGGSLIIPSFAVGRSQRILYLLRELEEAKKIPVLPVFLDSPMAVSAVSMYCEHLDEHDFEMEQLMVEACPLESGSIRLVKSVEESKALNQQKYPCVIVSASGNLAGGRILHHLKNRLSDHRNTVLFVGYQPQGSLGRLILEGKEEVKIHGTRVAVRAQICSLDALSAHADSEEIVAWVSHIQHPPEQIFLVHGEPQAQEALKEKLEKVTSSRIMIPEYLEEIQLQ